MTDDRCANVRIGRQGAVLAAAFAAASAVVVLAAFVASVRVQVAVTGVVVLAALGLVGLTVVRGERRVRAAVTATGDRLSGELAAAIDALPDVDEDRMGRKVARRVDRLIRREYRQIEELVALYHEVAPPRALPSLRGWAASPDYQRVLFALVRELRPAVVVECGSGATTLVAARALQVNGAGRLVSLEHDADHAAATREHLVQAGLDGVARVVDAPLVDHDLEGEAWRWYDLSAVGPLADVGLVAVDGPPRAVGPLARYPVLPLLEHALAADARLLLDDADRVEEVETVQRWEQRRPELTWSRLGHEKGTVVLRLDGPVGD